MVYWYNNNNNNHVTIYMVLYP